MDKILTVIIPSYNVEKYLDEILPTYVIEDILDDIEVLIVNDGSRDRTSEIAKKYVSEYPQTFKLIDKPNGGHGSTINSGIASASGKYIKVIDGDDYVDSAEFTGFVNSLKKLDVDAIYTPFNRINETTKSINKITISKEYYDLVYDINDIDAKVFEKNYALHSLTFNTEILKKIPKISENTFYVDQEYIMYALFYVKTIKFMNYTVYQYRVGNDEQSMALKNQMKNVKMLDKVTTNILDFFYVNKKDMPQRVQKVFELRIAGLIHNLIHIYICIGDKQSKEKIIEIISKIKNNKEIIDGINGIEFRLLNVSYSLYYVLVYMEKFYRFLKLRK